MDIIQMPAYNLRAGRDPNPGARDWVDEETGESQIPPSRAKKPSISKKERADAKALLVAQQAVIDAEIAARHDARRIAPSLQPSAFVSPPVCAFSAQF
jgi:hypothetical protein